ncbi:ATP-grasp domain-containing protein [Micromonospora cathayae]|uniref:ATP-grasp domain-containing protein n=1 Tax=Micromonospora cathayae TaxID=3028804 RepID=A0ABY7ZP31_9ACTN|nr:ATP-grasp domain-containing protein [Micromonospora sp. HUAS 3]WDZ83714.1 ATP-grasp domain-containing protein [Micromonospora sp. HUAS 3]
MSSDQPDARPTYLYPAGPAVIVDPYSSGALYAPALTAAGVPVVAVLSAPQPPEVYAASYRPHDFAETVVVTGDTGPAVTRLRELRPRCVLPGTESGVEVADAIAPLVVPERANVPGLAAARRHKGEMAAAVRRAGLPVPAQLCTADPDEVARWLVASGLTGRDLVIKPPKSAGTDGVTRVRAGGDWRAAFFGLLGTRNQLGIPNDRVLVQEYVSGDEYVVDTFSHDGRHTVADVCRYRKIDNGGHMAVYESMDWLPPDAPEVTEVVAYARAVLDAVGLRFGAAHTEIMRTPDGCRLIEVAARPHGGGHPRFCRVATGDSQLDRAVRHLTGGTVPTGYTLRRHVRVVFLISRAAGTVTNAEILDGVHTVPSLLHASIGVRTGDRIEVTTDLFGSLDLGFAVLAHEDPAVVEADHRRIRQLEGGLRVRPADDDRRTGVARR